MHIDKNLHSFAFFSPSLYPTVFYVTFHFARLIRAFNKWNYKILLLNLCFAASVVEHNRLLIFMLYSATFYALRLIKFLLHLTKLIRFPSFAGSFCIFFFFYLNLSHLSKKFVVHVHAVTFVTWLNNVQQKKNNS